MKSQWMVRNEFRSTFLIIFTASFFALFGCAVTGKTVPVESRIPLVSGGIQKGEQVVGGVTITYTYRLTQKTSDLSGLLEIEGSAQSKNISAKILQVWVDFLDSEGKILERKILCKLLGLGLERGEFQGKLDAPAGTTSMSFATNVAPYMY